MNGDIILSSKFFLKILFIFNELILLSAALGPRCCVGAFSNCGECGLLSSCGVRASHCQPSLLLWGVRASVAMSPGPRAGVRGPCPPGSRPWAQESRPPGSRARAQEPHPPGSRARAQELCCTGFTDPQHMGASWTRDWNHVSCTARLFKLLVLISD